MSTTLSRDGSPVVMSHHKCVGTRNHGRSPETLAIIDADLRRGFGIARPRILVTGLNPHAGESGHMGREEIDIIAPALAQAKDAGIDARGPFPADTLFQPRHLRDADCVLAMYHDQGHSPIKVSGLIRV